MYSVIKTAVVCGFESLPVQVETDVSDGMPSFDMVGFLTSEVKEARERVRTALKNAGFRLPAKKITINLTPADVRKSGTGCDLPMAASVLAAFGFLDEHILSSYLLLGEVGLNGSILPTKGGAVSGSAGTERRHARHCGAMGECQGSSNPGYCKSDSGEKFKRVCADLSAGIAGNLLLPGTAGFLEDRI